MEDRTRPVEGFEEEIEALTRLLATDRPQAVAQQRATQEEWARALLGLPSTRHPNGSWAFEPRLVADVRRLVEGGLAPETADEAQAHLAEAERWQWEIGTWASGSGEGLSSMFEVRSLQLARAWLLAACADTTPRAAQQARALAKQVVDDPNNIAARHAKHADALFRRLAQSDPR